MGEALQLLLLLLAIYLYECAQWTPLSAIGFQALVPWHWRRAVPWAAGPSWRRGALLGVPWPPLLPPLVVEPLPLRLGPQGIWLPGSEPRWRSWEELGEVAVVDRELTIGGEHVLRFATRRLALNLGRLLREVAELKPARREARLRKFLQARWDETGCRPRLAEFWRTNWPLLVAANLLWLCVFVGVPLLVWTPLTVFWRELAVMALLAWIGAAVTFRVLLPRQRWLEQPAWPDGTHRFMAVASPISSLRALDLLGRELLADLEPQAVSAALLPAPQFGELARHQLLDLEESRAAAASSVPAAAEDAAWLDAELRKLLEGLLRRRDLSAEKLLAPPVPEDERVQAWCPRCRSQYLQGSICPGARCGGRPLRQFQRE